MGAEKVEAKAPHDLRAGDVVFWHGRGLLSRLIQRLDGTRWSHVSIVAGTVGPEVVHVESVGGGVTASTVEWETLTRPGRTEIVRPSPVDEALGVVAASKASKYIGRPYAAHTLTLLAVVLLAREGKLPRFFGRACAWLARRGGKESLICSELVRRAYRDAGVELCPGRPDLTTPGDLWRTLDLEIGNVRA